MKLLFAAAALSAGLLCWGCAAHTNIVPLGNGHLAPSISIGGPIVEAFGTNIPVPYLAAGADYGISSDVNLNAVVHLLPLAYSVAGFDVGTTWFPLENSGWQPAIGVGPRLFVFASTKNDVDDRYLIYPAISASAAWSTGPGLVYTGADVAMPLTRSDFDEEAQRVMFSPFVGFRWNVGKRYALLTELQWHGANIKTEEVATNYTAIGAHGALTPRLAIQRRF